MNHVFKFDRRGSKIYSECGANSVASWVRSGGKVVEYELVPVREMSVHEFRTRKQRAKIEAKIKRLGEAFNEANRDLDALKQSR